jgi:MinD-like ATPase involved in chromosome partitioning or flagellar assembly
MEIILIITEDNELIENIPKIKLQNHNILVLSNINYIRHYLEEYMPKYIVLSAKFKNYKEVTEYINSYADSELFITDSEDEKGLISRNIYPGKIENIEDLKRILEVIDNLNLKVDRKKEDNYKFIPQQIISFYSIQGGVGKTSIVFNFAWYIKDIIEGKILIIDLNFCEGPSDLTINLDLNLSPNLSVFIEKITQGKDCFNKSIIGLDDDNKIDILQPPLSIYQSDKFNIDMLNSIIYSARNEYNIIIADVPFRYDNISLEMLNLSTTSILVLSPDIKLAPRVINFQKFLPDGQRRGIIFNKVSQSERTYIDEYKSILGIPVYDRISFIPEEDRRVITNGRNSFNILDLQSRMPDLRNIIF